MRRALPTFLAAIAALLLALALTACGGDDEAQTPAQERQAAQERAEAAQREADAEVEARNQQVLEEFEQRKAAEEPSEEETQATQSATNVYAGLRAVGGLWFVRPDANVRAGIEAADGNEALTSVCELISEEAKAETISYAELSSGLGEIDWSCERAMALLVRRANANKAAKRIRQAKVLTVNAEGDRATATVSFGKGTPVSTILLVKEDGQWKLGVSPAGG